MFSQVSILGAGQMGSGIAQIIAQKNISVYLIDLNKDSLQTAQQQIKKSLNKLYKKKLITILPDNAFNNIHFTSQFSSLKNSELIIEAVPENKPLKLKIFKQISDLCSPDAIITSNTSSISITSLAQVVKYPKQVAGLHFMNPVPLMKLIEIISTNQTSPLIFKKLHQFATFLNKQSVTSKDKPGFIINRILMPMINEAIFVLQESIASAEDIDKAMQLGCHYPMGPLALADFIGLDTCLSIMIVLEQELGSKYAPCPLLKKYVSHKFLGKKSGKGFYTY